MSQGTPVAIVTGGSGGLGSAIAARLRPRWRVVVASRRPADAEGVSLDVTDEAGCARVVEATLARHGRLDALVNAAGLWLEGPLDRHPPGSMKSLIEVNVLGTLLMCKAVLPALRARGAGTIVNINSQGGLYAKAERSAYTATKWAITGFSRAIRAEAAPHGIRVIDVLPGKMRTELFRRAGVEKGLVDALEPDEVAEVVAYAMGLPPHVMITELGVRHLANG